MKKALLFVALFAALAAFADAASRKMYRYTNAEGKEVYVADYKDVPAEFRPSASAALIGAEDVAPAENGPVPGSAEPPAEKKTAPDGGEQSPPAQKGTSEDAVRVADMQFGAAEDGKGRFTGSVINGLAEKAQNIALHFEIGTTEGNKAYDFPVKGGEALAPNETVPINVMLDLPAAEIKGYRYSLKWETEKMVPITVEEPKKPAAEEAPAKETASPAKGKRR